MNISKKEINFINNRIKMLEINNDLSTLFLISRLIDEIILRQNNRSLFH